MKIDEYHRKTTWQLGDEHSRHYEFLLRYNEKVNARFWFFYRDIMRYNARKQRADESLRIIEQVLIDRYRGVVADLLMAASGGSAQPTFLKQLIADMLLGLAKRLYGPYDGVTFSAALWRCVTKELLQSFPHAQEQLDKVKGKFMLRQFVDLMGPTELRGFLRLRVFNGLEYANDITGEAAWFVADAYAALHAVVFEHRPSLAFLTDGAIDVTNVHTRAQISDFYRIQLFPVY